MPAAVFVDKSGTAGFGYAEHATIYMRRNAIHDRLGNVTTKSVGGPSCFDEFCAAADTSRGDQNRFAQ